MITTLIPAILFEVLVARSQDASQGLNLAQHLGCDALTLFVLVNRCSVSGAPMYLATRPAACGAADVLIMCTRSGSTDFESVIILGSVYIKLRTFWVCSAVN